MIQADTTSGQADRAGISVRIAVYRGSEGPEITEVAAANPRAATAKISRLIMERASERIPEVAVREIVENLIHAEYRGVIISVLDNGSVVRVSDKGPGVWDKSRAMEFGFSGARPEALREIRGIGAGLGMARQAVEKVGGTIIVEDNIGGGTVATISASSESVAPPETTTGQEELPRRRYPDAVPRMNLSERQQRVLITVLEYGEAGPSTVAEELEISVSTAYRDLSALEENGLIVAEESGKRSISPMGRDLVEAIVSSWVR